MLKRPTVADPGYGHTNPDNLKPNTFLHKSAFRPHETSESGHQNHIVLKPHSREVYGPVQTSLLVLSRNAPLRGGALRDDTKNVCVADYVQTNRDSF